MANDGVASPDIEPVLDLPEIEQAVSRTHWTLAAMDAIDALSEGLRGRPRHERYNLLQRAYAEIHAARAKNRVFDYWRTLRADIPRDLASLLDRLDELDERTDCYSSLPFHRRTQILQTQIALISFIRTKYSDLIEKHSLVEHLDRREKLARHLIRSIARRPRNPGAHFLRRMKCSSPQQRRRRVRQRHGGRSASTRRVVRRASGSPPGGKAGGGDKPGGSHGVARRQFPLGGRA